MKRHTFLLLTLLLTITGIRAQSANHHGISAPGAAVAEFSPDWLAVDFELETTSGSFSEASNATESVASKLREIALPGNDATLKVTYDLTFMRQRKLTRGKKLEHSFRVTVQNVSDGKAEETMIALVEDALLKIPGLAVAGFESGLSQNGIKRAQKQLLKQAVANAEKNASTAADAARLRLLSARSIRIGDRGPRSNAADYDGFLVEQVTVYARKSFVVRDNFKSKIRISVNVIIDFNSEPK